MRSNAELHGWAPPQEHDAVLVPFAAIFRRDGVEAVFVVADGRAQLAPITTRRRGEHAVEVLSGLRSGEQVILYPGNTITDTTAVRPASD